MKPNRHVKILEIIENRTISTQQELRDLVAYAQERFINIIPEC